MTLVIIRYGEIGLKSNRVRRRFQSKLVDNIEDRFLHEGVECIIEQERGRLYLHTPEFERASAILKKVFGIVSFSPVIQTTSDMKDICEKAAEYSKDLVKKDSSFAIKARRTGNHKYTSMELAKEAGSAVYLANEEKNIRVDLTNPDQKILIEVRNNRAYIFHRTIKGPGGMPVGTQGRVLAFLEDEKSMTSAWLMMKRGCTVKLVYSEDEALDEYYPLLKRWDINLKAYKIEDDIMEKMDYLVKNYKAEGIVLGWNMEELEERKLKSDFPVFYPIIGMTEDDLKEIMKKIKE